MDSGQPYAVTLNEPVGVLALSWDAGWEFDAPVVLLEPVKRYGSSGSVGCESLVEDALIDIVVNHDLGKPTRAGRHAADLKEFAWRGWSEAEFRRWAADPPDGVHVHRETVVFYLDNRGETAWRTL